MSAASKGYKEIVKLLLDRGAKVEAESSRRGTALVCAASHGDKEIVRLLLDRTTKLEYSDDKLNFVNPFSSLFAQKRQALKFVSDLSLNKNLPIATQIAAVFRSYWNAPFFSWRHHINLANAIANHLGSQPHLSHKECIDYIKGVTPSNINQEGTLAGLIMEIEGWQYTMAFKVENGEEKRGFQI